MSPLPDGAGPPPSMPEVIITRTCGGGAEFTIGGDPQTIRWRDLRLAAAQDNPLELADLLGEQPPPAGQLTPPGAVEVTLARCYRHILRLAEAHANPAT